MSKKGLTWSVVFSVVMWTVGCLLWRWLWGVIQGG